MRRRATAILLGLAAVGTLSAAKPVPLDDLPGNATQRLLGQAWRTRGVPICVAELRAIREFTPDDLESICGCTFDTYLQQHGTGPLPGMDNDRIPVGVGQQLVGCTARIRPDQVGAAEHFGLVAPNAPPVAAIPGADAPKPVDQVDVGPPAEAGTNGDSGGFWEWVRSLSLPAWLTGAGALLWVALGILVIGLLILKVRRRDPRNDLLGPPSSMRRGTPPQPPRRPDLPR